MILEKARTISAGRVYKLSLTGGWSNYSRLLSGACLCWFMLGTLCSQASVQGRALLARPVSSSGSLALVRDGQGAGAASQDFEKLAAQARDARENNRVDEALSLYRRALAVRPQWDEGWWYLATLLYDQDQYGDAARAFQEAARLQPKAGMIWAMLGLCEFELGNYQDALRHLRQGRQLGIPVDNRELARVIRYHEGLLLLLTGDFETAQQALDSLSYEGVRTDDLIIALGFSVLRIQSLPQKIDPAAVALVKRAGEAEYLAATKKFDEAQKAYASLVADYSRTHNVQYAYGVFLLLNREDEKAVAAFKHEIENTPEHRLARLMIATTNLRNKDAAGGIPFVEASLKLYPQDPLGHYILGRLLLEREETERAIRELEAARVYYKEEPKIYFQLARAYARVNRKEDASRAREEFIRLNKLREESPEGARQGEALPEENSVETKPAKP
jgi:predicted Zn-dependent protease